MPCLFTLTLLALLGSVPLAPVDDPPPASVLVEREAFLMGTQLRASVVAPDAAHGFAAIEAAFQEVARLEELLSDWRAESGLSRLNAAPVGVTVYPPPELFRLLIEVREWTQRSGGAFNAGVGPLIDAWDLRGSGRRPNQAELAAALRRSEPDAFRLNVETGGVVRLLPGAWMTAGGFGKGAALRGAAVKLREAGIHDATLDFGGQILAMGSPAGGDGWAISVAHPARRGEPAAELAVSSRSVATSGASERYVEVGGERLGHLLDPRTGRPVPAWGSVTVVHEDPLAADIIATALFVMEPEEGMRWAETFADTGVLFLREISGAPVLSANRAMGRWLTTGKESM